jgi:hypothetical protein
MDDEERRQITEKARAYAESERYDIPAMREQPAEVQTEELVAQECKRAFDSWNASAADEPAEPDEPPEDAWNAWLTARLEAERTVIGDVIAESMAQFVAEQVRLAKVEMLTEINALRLEFIKEQSEFVREQKIMLTNVRDLLSKIKDREFRGEELPSSLN